MVKAAFLMMTKTAEYRATSLRSVYLTHFTVIVVDWA